MLLRRADQAANGRASAAAGVDDSDTDPSSTRLARKEESPRTGAQVAAANAEYAAVSEQLTPFSPRLDDTAEGRNGSGIEKDKTPPRWYNRRLGPTALLAVVAFVALVAWLVLEARPTGSSDDENVPVALSADGLATVAKNVPQPIYWVGPDAAVTYELTRSLDRTYVRYLPTGVTAGDPRPFLTIGTYAMANAYAVMKRNFGTPGNRLVDTPKGGIAVIDESRPTSVYVAYPNTDFQIEIYSPDADQAREYALGDKAQPVTATTSEATGPVVATAASLKALATSLGHPVYWAGAQPNTTLELTQTTDGRTFVRYLPAGAAAGDKAPYLTIATYPLEDAYAATKASASGSASVTLTPVKGRIAVYANATATNVHLADKGVAVQVEVYDPSPAVPPSLVRSGAVVPVG
jgi:hypothetical protein